MQRQYHWISNLVESQGKTHVETGAIVACCDEHDARETVTCGQKKVHQEVFYSLAKFYEFTEGTVYMT